MSTTTRGAVLRTAPGRYEIADLEVDDPGPGEVRVRMAAAGLCHSDDHFATGDSRTGILPWAGGHEGAGVVEEVGPDVRDVTVGDHVVFSFLPACGRCRWCASGMQNLCDLGRFALAGGRLGGPRSYRMHLDGEPVGQMCGVSTFVERTTVDARSVVRIDEDVPLDLACLIGCAVCTGWGSAVHTAEAGPGDTVVVVGVGGIGMNAVQGARHAGAAHVVAVDPVEWKRDLALRLGATVAVATVEEAVESARVVTNGQGADSAVVAVGVTRPEHVAAAFAAVRKAGIVVVTGLGDQRETGVPVSLTELTLFQKQLRGSLFGACAPTRDIPRLAQLWRTGAVALEPLVTRRYALDEIDEGYRDLREGRTLRGVLVLDPELVTP